MASSPPTVLIVGAGERGQIYADYIRQHPEAGRVVGVAEPRAFQREAVRQTHDLPPDRVFEDWREAARQARCADAVVIATQDAMHVEPAEAFAARGYHMLLEKPMATDEEGGRRVLRAVQEAGILFALGTVLRYTPYTRRLKALIEDGRIGDLVSIQHLEPVGYWHQAHAFVRGNWRNEAESSPMLLQKSCHDLDWLGHLVNAPCRRVSSFGSLLHFRPEHRPEGAADRCLDCAVEADCPYSAPRIYGRMLDRGLTGWPLSVLTDQVDREGLHAALAEGPYGRCVYACDNDVVDHQVVSLEYANGVSATFTMTAFTGRDYGRTTRLFGTRGEIFGDSRILRITDFLTEEKETIDVDEETGGPGDGHGGGDGGLMADFLEAVARGESRGIASGIQPSWESHHLIFAAERARHTRSTVELPLSPHAGLPASPTTTPTGTTP